MTDLQAHFALLKALEEESEEDEHPKKDKRKSE